MPPATIAARSGVVARRGFAIAVLSITGLAAAATAASAAEVDAGEPYEVAFEDNRIEDRIDDGSVTVVSGDTLSLIAADVGLDEVSGWRVLFDANDDIDDADLIMPGQEVEVPQEGDELERRAAATGSADAGSGGDAGSSDEGQADSADQGEADESATSEASSEPAQEEPAPEEDSAPAPAETESTAGGSVWDRLAECESNGDWTINTGNGYYGGLQFHPQTWAAHGGHEFAPNAHQATREQEIVIAERVLESQGWGAWPACSSQLGLR